MVAELERGDGPREEGVELVCEGGGRGEGERVEEGEGVELCCVRYRVQQLRGWCERVLMDGGRGTHLDVFDCGSKMRQDPRGERAEEHRLAAQLHVQV